MSISLRDLISVSKSTQNESRKLNFGAWVRSIQKYSMKIMKYEINKSILMLEKSIVMLRKSIVML